MTIFNYKPKIKVKGYHGTDSANTTSILGNNFMESKNDTWYGDAVYFFIDGISAEPPEMCAAQYAKDSSWNKDLKDWKYKEYSVMEAEIKVNEDKLLDLTITLGAQLFNEYRQQYLKIIEESGKKVFKEILDAHMLNTMRKNLGIEFVKGNVYIKMAMQRRQKIDSRIPNVTIFAVNNPLKNIQQHTIKQHSKGEIL